MPTPTAIEAPAGSAPVAPASAPAPAAPAPAAVPATPSKPDLKAVMAKMSPEERRLVATGKIDQLKKSSSNQPAAPAATAEPAPAPAAAPAAVAAEPAPAAPAEPTPTAEPAPAASTPTTAEPSITEEIPEPGQAGDGKGKRFRFSSEEDQTIAAIAKSKGISLLAAAEVYKGKSESPAPAAAAPAPVAEPAVDPAVVQYDSEIATVDEQIKKLTDARDKAADDFDTKKNNELSDQIADLRADRKLLLNAKQGHLTSSEQNVRKAHDAKINASRDRAFVEFPAFAKEDSMERLALDSFVTRAINDPKRKAEFSDPAWPEKLAREFAEKNGIKKSAPAGTAPAPAAPAAPAKPATLPRQQPQQVTPAAGARLLTGAGGDHNPNAPRPLTKDRVREMVRTDPQARRAVMHTLFHGKTPAG